MKVGIRQQKMRKARLAMERAAVELAYEHGARSVTVEQICAQAGVSRSTFFNYFTSLDQAIFGSTLEYEKTLTDAILSQYSKDLAVGAVLIVMRSVRGDLDDELTKMRYALFVREPGTTARVSWTSDASREGLVSVIEEWLREHPEDARLPDVPARTEARIIVAMSITLADEVQRLAQEIDGEWVVDPDAYRIVREQIAAVAAPSARS